MKFVLSDTTKRHIIYKIKHDYLQLNTIVLALALVIATYLAWQSVARLQQNYTQQRELETKRRQLVLTELETQTLQYQKNFRESDEYKELAAREKLGLVAPGEKVIVLPKNSPEAHDPPTDKPTNPDAQSSNLEQWVTFLFGGAAEQAQQKDK